jgi:hypothetical protein
MEAAGARAGLGLGAVTCVVVALAGFVALRRLPGERAVGSARAQVGAASVAVEA